MNATCKNAWPILPNCAQRARLKHVPDSFAPFYIDTPPQPAVVGTLVCIPGLNSGAYLFGGAQAALPRWQIIRFTTPGVEGVPLPMPFTVKAYAKHVFKHLQHIPLTAGPLVVLGHSLGSYAAQELAKIMGPRLGRLVLVATSSGQPHTAQDVGALEAKMGQNFWQLMQALVANPAQGLLPFFGPRWPLQQPHAYAQFVAAREAALPSQAATLAQLSAGAMFSSARWVHKLLHPTLVLHGTEDILVSPTSAKALAAALPNAHLLLLHEVGHFPPLEHPNFWQYVADFCQGVHLGDKIIHQSGWRQWFTDFWERQG